MGELAPKGKSFTPEASYSPLSCSVLHMLIYSCLKRTGWARYYDLKPCSRTRTLEGHWPLDRASLDISRLPSRFCLTISLELTNTVLIGISHSSDKIMIWLSDVKVSWPGNHPESSRCLCTDHWPKCNAHFPIFPSCVKPPCIPHLVTKHPAQVFNSIRRSLSDFVSDKCDTCQYLGHPLLSHKGAIFLSICFFIVLLNDTQLTFYLRYIIHGTIKHDLLYLSIFSFNLSNFRESI